MSRLAVLVAALGLLAWVSVFWYAPIVEYATAAYCSYSGNACSGSGSPKKVAGVDWDNARAIAIHEEKCMTIESPVDADNFIIYRADKAVTITGIDCIVEDATSVPITLQETDADGNSPTTIEATMTCLTTNTAHSGAIDAPLIEAGNRVRVDVGLPVDTPGHVNVCMAFDRDQ